MKRTMIVIAAVALQWLWLQGASAATTTYDLVWSNPDLSSHLPSPTTPYGTVTVNPLANGSFGVTLTVNPALFTSPDGTMYFDKFAFNWTGANFSGTVTDSTPAYKQLKINNKQPDSSGNYSLTGITDSQNISAFGRFDLEMEATFKNHSGSFSSWSFTLAPTGASGNANFDTTTGPYIFAAHLRGFNNLGATGETITSAWLAAGPRTPPVASVPLPSTLVLLAGAMAGLTGMGRGKKVFSRRR